MVWPGSRAMGVAVRGVGERVTSQTVSDWGTTRVPSGGVRAWPGQAPARVGGVVRVIGVAAFEVDSGDGGGGGGGFDVAGGDGAQGLGGGVESEDRRADGCGAAVDGPAGDAPGGGVVVGGDGDEGGGALVEGDGAPALGGLAFDGEDEFGGGLGGGEDQAVCWRRAQGDAVHAAAGQVHDRGGGGDGVAGGRNGEREFDLGRVGRVG